VAEKVVLASLSVDSSGVVTGIKESNAAIGKGEAAVKAFSASTQKSILPAGLAMRAAGLEFGGVGRVLEHLGPLGLAVGAGFLAIRAALNTPEVKAFGEEFGKASSSLAHFALEATGVTWLLNKITGGLKGANLALAADADERTFLQRTLDDLDRLGVHDPREQLAPLVQALADVRKAALDKPDFGQSPLDRFKAQALILEIAKKAQGTGLALPDQLQKIVDLLPKVTAAAKPAADALAGLKLNGTSLDLGINALLKETTGGSFSEDLQKLNLLQVALAELQASGQHGEEFQNNINRIVAAISTLQQSMGGDLGSFMSSFFAVDEDQQARFNEAMTAATTKVQEGWLQIEESVTAGQAAFQAMNDAIGTLGGVLAETFVTGRGHVKQAIAGMLKDMSRLFFTYALANLAMAAMATTGAGAALLQGTPAQFAQAAGLFFAAGAAAGVASRALGGGQAAAARTGGRGGGGGNGGGGRGTQNITVVIQGSVDNPDAFARKIAKRLATATADGAA